MEKARVRPLEKQLGDRNRLTMGVAVGLDRDWCRVHKRPRGYLEGGFGRERKAGPSPEDVEADVALEVNVGMINHCFTLHLGRVMWVTLSHLAPEKEK